ncbi:MAG: ribonuclease P protein component [Candidatus Caldatribacterium sp.]|uniref:ribonuclease P protein component n=1 Tax=Candidatus Caldatribacterium sp. TaxID=2282143 RepID=UPI00299454CB|nr:ribonuclease P protein component [Candidatus Caldatribacterium sp.]MCX7730373.1 ribonuclease P protein component [Candidatus Caldatribacterium sp.]MDW8081911.1 ribonuclease P protein component [Candidatus Calescibacterium sp.]
MMETLTKEKDFARLFAKGQRVSCGPLRLFFYQRETGPVRVCFAGRSKKAVRRNRIRRRLREAFRVHYYPAWKDKPFDFFFLGDEEVASVDFASLVLWMGELLERVEQNG